MGQNNTQSCNFRAGRAQRRRASKQHDAASRPFHRNGCKGELQALNCSVVVSGYHAPNYVRTMNGQAGLRNYLSKPLSKHRREIYFIAGCRAAPSVAERDLLGGLYVGRPGAYVAPDAAVRRVTQRAAPREVALRVSRRVARRAPGPQPPKASALLPELRAQVPQAKEAHYDVRLPTQYFHSCQTSLKTSPVRPAHCPPQHECRLNVTHHALLSTADGGPPALLR